MNKYYDPNLSQETLETYQGYSLQVFTSGRIKLSFHITHRHRNEYYAVRPNRFREAYAKQHQRSQLALCIGQRYTGVLPQHSDPKSAPEG
jgi:hypothetical protein